MIIKKFKYIILIALTVSIAIGCSDDSENPPAFVNAGDLFLELNYEGNTVRYEGGFPNGWSYYNSGDLVYQNIPISYFFLDSERRIDSIALLSLTNFRFFPFQEDSSLLPPLVIPTATNAEIINIIRSNNWKFGNSRSLEPHIWFSIIGSDGTSHSDDYSLIEAPTNYLNFTDVFSSKIYFSGTDRLSEEEYVVFFVEFRAKLVSPIDTLDVVGNLRAALNNESIGNSR